MTDPTRTLAAPTFPRGPRLLPAEAFLVDLDDTLYPQADWLAGAWAAVADAGAGRGLDRDALHRALVETCAEGSDRGRIIDRALDRVGAPDGLDVAPLVAVFTSHRPARLAPYPGVPDALARLRATGPVVCVTDGRPEVQHAKVAALGLDGLLTAVVVSDELGRRFRKPHPAPFRRALHLVGVDGSRVVHIGDRPEKDVDGGVGAGLRVVRVTTGEYAGAPDARHRPWRTVATFAQAADAALEGTPALTAGL